MSYAQHVQKYDRFGQVDVSFGERLSPEESVSRSADIARARMMRRYDGFGQLDALQLVPGERVIVTRSEDRVTDNPQEVGADFYFYRSYSGGFLEYVTTLPIGTTLTFLGRPELLFYGKFRRPFPLYKLDSSGVVGYISERTAERYSDWLARQQATHVPAVPGRIPTSPSFPGSPLGVLNGAPTSVSTTALRQRTSR